ncbi:hypothetical protein I5Q34_20365 [Streptomyces sp. AV19]|uniref:hypothetical protein n=1 Tax=Streptomyces sp. AV19 TaxID=2793068 RepID=UPI0018FEC68C|nr:hypothetical protein [Streptomyces sp. AV19]MBH1936602.1 hypothetical protein [Streptomyces sp. AV19]MDG4532662.1 hypothetical protein [Streptomyces sp. AV19]
MNTDPRHLSHQRPDLQILWRFVVTTPHASGPGRGRPGAGTATSLDACRVCRIIDQRMVRATRQGDAQAERRHATDKVNHLKNSHIPVHGPVGPDQW